MIHKFKPGDEVRVVKPIQIKIPDGRQIQPGERGTVMRLIDPSLELVSVMFHSLDMASIIVGMDQIELVDHSHAVFTARQEMYRLGKTHAAELQRLRDRIAQLEEQKRQAVIALGFEDPDKVGM